ncbi:hypothetical protein HMPREF9548_01952 [Escherichia coli MS 182-1]|nr:hypothetical protein HMPREF9548_01952 [Escherichia coli MS 182-1]
MCVYYCHQNAWNQNALALKPQHEAGGRAGKALRAGGGADFIFSASERAVMTFRLLAGALVCLRDVLCGGERVRA